MKEFISKEVEIELRHATACSAEVLMASREIASYGAYIGLDVHKDTIAIAIADPGRDDPWYRGEIANTPKAITKLVERLN